MLSQLGRTYRRLAYTDTAFVATFSRCSEDDDLADVGTRRTSDRYAAGARRQFDLIEVDERSIRVQQHPLIKRHRPLPALTATLQAGADDRVATGTALSPRVRVTHGIWTLLLAAIWFMPAESIPLPPRLAVAAVIVVSGASGAVASEIRCFGMFRRLEEAVGVRMTHLTVERPSSWLHWQVTRLACRLTWRDLRLDRGHGSRLQPS